MLGALLLAIGLCGCLSRSRLNETCDWVGDSPIALNAERASDRRHLVEDVELAEELSIRYGDSFRKQFGRLEEHARAAACQGKLFDTIAQIHQVTPQDVRVARSIRRAWVDPLSLIVLGALYCVVSAKLVRTICKRLSAGGMRPLLVGLGLGAVAISFCGLICLNLIWVPLVETIRTGNMHRSFRAAQLPWSNHLVALYIGGVVIFIALAFAYQLRSPEPET